MTDFGRALSGTGERWEGRRASVALVAVNERLLGAVAGLVSKAGYHLIVCRRFDQLTSQLDSRYTDAIRVDLELPVGVRGIWLHWSVFPSWPLSYR
jgi:hypothetical protein